MTYSKSIELYNDNTGKVEYISHMGTDLTVCNSARVSFGKEKETLDDKDKKLHAIGDEIMCRIASLLPNNRQGPFSGHHKIKTYQRENGIVPSPQPFFKEMPEE